jgi:hypothetical protein
VRHAHQHEAGPYWDAALTYNVAGR